ncbi:hypothetical protein SPONL_431 [uncultured Candidatus Thioglobus sp.]|nr:hypothetical protein SPONL_431 [uncultured Candidatus Thioglobus sp.]
MLANQYKVILCRSIAHGSPDSGIGRKSAKNDKIFRYGLSGN